MSFQFLEMLKAITKNENGFPKIWRDWKSLKIYGFPNSVKHHMSKKGKLGKHCVCGVSLSPSPNLAAKEPPKLTEREQTKTADMLTLLLCPLVKPLPPHQTNWAPPSTYRT
jgi:hypothetical protein